MADKEGRGQVDPRQLVRYLEIEKEIQQLESVNALKTYEVKLQAANDVEETCMAVALTLEQLKLQTAEKQRIAHLKGGIKDFIAGEEFDEDDITKEQEEYMEALNKEECTKKKLEGLQQQYKELKLEAAKFKNQAEKLRRLYEERDNLLSDVFMGEYGSELENQLEVAFDNLMDQKQRVSVANYKWTNARVLLQHAVRQLSYAVHRWKELYNIPLSNPALRYNYATETRNNLVAAQQNVNGTQKYLSNITFPYCAPAEMQTLGKAINNIYTDMQTPERHAHALECYDVTMRRAAALLQWFDNVIKGTIQQDLIKATKAARETEQKLRAERVRLLRAKIEESGGDVSALSEAGLRGWTGQTDADLDLGDEKVGVIKADKLEGMEDTPGGKGQDGFEAPSAVPLSELAPLPTTDELFGNISQLKQTYEKDTAEFIKAQELNRARMEQGLQAKLQARRHKKNA